MTFRVICAPLMKQCNCCCCSCSLKITAIILGWLQLVVGITVLVGAVTSMFVEIDDGSEDVKGVRLDENVMRIIFIGAMAATVASLILDILLLYGIHSGKPVFMLPYVVLELIGFVLLTLYILSVSIYLIILKWTVGVGLLVTGILICVICFYIWDVFYSYYRQLEDERVTRVPY